MRRNPTQTAIIRPVDFYEWQAQGRIVVQQTKSPRDFYTFFVVTFHQASNTYATVRFDASCLDGSRSESDVWTFQAMGPTLEALRDARLAALAEMDARQENE